MRFFSLSIITSLAAFTLAACATSERVVVENKAKPGQDASTTLPEVTDATTFCGSMCARIQSCDATLDTQTCQNRCTNTNAAIFPRLRSDVVDLVVQCFDAKDCKTVLGGGFVGVCTADAVASVAPSTAAASFCDALASSKKTCSGTTTDAKATCLNTAKLYNDDAIAQAQNCTKRGCSEIDACVGAVFGSLAGATTTTPPTTTCSSSTFSALGDCASCAGTSCCTEATACQADTSCWSIARTCSSGVGSSSCSSAFTGASSSSQTLAASLMNCATSKCSTTTCRLNGT